MAGACGVHPRESDYESQGTRVRKLYEVLDDAACSVLILERRKHCQPGQFNTRWLRALQRFVLRVGGAGLSRRGQWLLYEFLCVWDDHDDASPIDSSTDFSRKAAFPSPTSFVNALRDDIDNAALDAGWMKLRIKEGGVECEAYYRPVLEKVLKLVRDSMRFSIWSGKDVPAPPTDRRSTPMEGDAFRLCEKEVVDADGMLAFVLALHMYSDASQHSWSGAHKLYPVRARLVNDFSGAVTWGTVANIPLVRMLTKTAADDRSRLQRGGLLQRVLYACMRTAIAASHVGVEVRVGARMLTAFPRVLLYVRDQPEERAVLCMNSGKCQRPCTLCDVQVEVTGAFKALRASERSVLETLERQLELALLRQHDIERQRRETLEADHSLTGFVPAFSGMAGLSTSPYLL